MFGCSYMFNCQIGSLRRNPLLPAAPDLPQGEEENRNVRPQQGRDVQEDVNQKKGVFTKEKVDTTRLMLTNKTFINK